jgi:hypothetical protein
MAKVKFNEPTANTTKEAYSQQQNPLLSPFMIGGAFYSICFSVQNS